MAGYLAVLYENQMARSLPCQYGTAQNLQTHWWGTAPNAPPLDQLRQPTLVPMPHFPQTPQTPPGNNEGALPPEMEEVLPRYEPIHTPLRSAQCFDPDACTNHWQCDNDFMADLLTNEQTTTVQYTICCMVLQLTSILQKTAACWANLQLKTSIDTKEQNF